MHIILSRAVLIIENHVLLIENCKYPARICILTEFFDSSIEVRHMLCLDHSIIILHICGNPSGDIQNINFLWDPRLASVELRVRDILKLDSVARGRD